MEWIAAYALAGTLIGFLAGLLGIGGGMTLVPVLAAMFSAQRLAPGHEVHLALGTAMASVMFTSSASVRTHHRLGGVDWAIVARMAPGMVAGSLGSTLASGWVPQRLVTALKSVGERAVSAVRKPSPKAEEESWEEF